MKKRFLIIISSFLALVLLVTCGIVMMGCADIEDKKAKEEISIETESKYSYSVNNSERVMLSLSPYSTTNRATNVVTRRIIATIHPDEAVNKKVDWFVDWCVPFFEDADINDYITVTPDSDGSLGATITCKQAFIGGSAYVTCVSRLGGHTAQCLVVYEGVPTQIVPVDENGNDALGTLTLVTGNEYNYELDLRNTFNVVGDKYGNFEIKMITMQGKFQALQEEVLNGSLVASENVTIDLSEGKIGSYTYDTSKFLTASIEGNVLRIKPIADETSFLMPNAPVRTGFRYTYDSPYYPQQGGGNPSTCSWQIVVREVLTGVSHAFDIDIECGVSSVSLSNYQIVI